MKFFFGLLVGLAVAIAIAVGAAYYAFGGLTDVSGRLEARDDSQDLTQAYDLEGFDRIVIAGIYQIDVTVGGPFSVEVSGSQREIDNTEIGVEGGALVLDQEESEHGWGWWRDRKGLSARITMPALSEIEAAGVVSGEVAGVDAERFAASVAGVGDLDIAGRCGSLEADVAGVGELDAEDLQCRDVKVDVSGIGKASVYASESVDATIGGIGDITVYGSPETVEKSGGLISNITVK